jgi:hypothetical protein
MMTDQTWIGIRRSAVVWNHHNKPDEFGKSVVVKNAAAKAAFSLRAMVCVNVLPSLETFVPLEVTLPAFLIVNPKEDPSIGFSAMVSKFGDPRNA